MGLFRSRSRPPAPLFAAMGVVAIVGFALATYQEFREDTVLNDRGQQAPARVVEKRPKRIIVEFSMPDGRQMRARIGDLKPNVVPEVGDEIIIVYDPQNPMSDVRDARAGDNHRQSRFSLIMTLVAAVGIPACTIALVRANRRERRSR